MFLSNISHNTVGALTLTADISGTITFPIEGQSQKYYFIFSSGSKRYFLADLNQSTGNINCLNVHIHMSGSNSQCKNEISNTFTLI